MSGVFFGESTGSEARFVGEHPNADSKRESGSCGSSRMIGDEWSEMAREAALALDFVGVVVVVGVFTLGVVVVETKRAGGDIRGSVC